MSTLIKYSNFFAIYLLSISSLFAQETNTLIESAVSFQMEGDFEKAINIYTSLIGIEAGNEDHYIKRGTLYYELGNYYAAKADFVKATKINPENANAHYNLGILYSDIEENGYDYAVKEFSKAIRIEPSNPYSYIMRAFCYSYMNMEEEAYWDFAIALQINPEETKAYYSMASVMGMLSEPQKSCQFAYDAALDGSIQAKMFYLALCN